jgi:hypothetical protein
MSDNLNPYEQGVLLHQQGQLEAALKWYAVALQQKPAHAPSWNNQGAALYALGRLPEAARSFRQAIALDPRYVSALNNLACVLESGGESAAALPLLQQALQWQPHDASAHNNLGNSLLSLERYDEALAAYQRAIDCDPCNATYHTHCGNAWYEMGRTVEAIGCYDQAIALAPNEARTYSFKALALLRLGDFEQGWRLHEWRWQKSNFTSPRRDFKAPLWLGQTDLKGQTLLLHSEQGLGDTLQFCRFIPQVLALGVGRLCVEVPASLLGLLQYSIAGVDQWIAKGQPLPDFDWHCPLMSLPLAFGTRMESIPLADQAYLFAKPSLVQAWAQKLGPRVRPRVGWVSKTSTAPDRGRSMDVVTFVQAWPSEVEGICLQKELSPEERAVLDQAGMRFWGDGLTDFDATAALCAHLDAVVSIDTSVVHLAAAMGLPTWVLLPFSADWRWMQSRDDSPWYRSVRLLRQPRHGDWRTVLEQMRMVLTQMSEASQNPKINRTVDLSMHAP